MCTDGPQGSANGEEEFDQGVNILSQTDFSNLLRIACCQMSEAIVKNYPTDKDNKGLSKKISYILLDYFDPHANTPEPNKPKQPDLKSELAIDDDLANRIIDILDLKDALENNDKNIVEQTKQELR